MLQQAPKEEVAKMLRWDREAGPQRPEGHQPEDRGQQGDLELTGKLADGRASSGKATLVKEGRRLEAGRGRLGDADEVAMVRRWPRRPSSSR
jgi:hypothetical protein